jgi:hypothetical protein
MAPRDTAAEALARRPASPFVTEVRPPSDDVVPLADIEPGRRVELVSFGAALDRSFCDQLLAYGVQPRHAIDVLQQQPMTVIVCDHVELALETAVARLIDVRPLLPR